MPPLETADTQEIVFENNIHFYEAKQPGGTLSPPGFLIIMPSKTAYENCLEAMYSLRRFGIKLGLATIRDALEKLGNPQNDYQCIHVAGTNGKGSVASALARILRDSGYKTGLYTSPHLIRFNERIAVNGNQISNNQVVETYHEVKKAHQGDRDLTFFEFATAMAFHHFSRQRVDWAVIETGMGGRLDATNIVRPALSIITNISIEHKDYLGATLVDIAGEKAGIIKRKKPVITGAGQEKAIRVIEKKAEKENARFLCFKKDFKVRRARNGIFHYYGVDHTWRNLKTGLMGHFQVENAALTLAACEVLLGEGLDLPVQSIRRGLRENKWPGRLEKVSDSPLVILDGAHNLSAARNLTKYLTEHLRHKKITLVLGMLNDKPYPAILRALLPVCNRVIFTQPQIDRSLPPEMLQAESGGMVKHVEVVQKVSEAVKHAIKTAMWDEVVCIAGSLYVVGEAKEFLEGAQMGAS